MSQSSMDFYTGDLAHVTGSHRQNDVLDVFINELQCRIDDLSERLRDGVIAQQQDQIEKARLQRRMENLLDAMPTAALMIDEHGVVTAHNRRAAELLPGMVTGICWTAIANRHFLPNERVDGDLRTRDGRNLLLSRTSFDDRAGEILQLDDVTESERQRQLLHRAEHLALRRDRTLSQIRLIEAPLSDALSYMTQVSAQATSEKRRLEYAAKLSACLTRIDTSLRQLADTAESFATGVGTVDVAGLYQEVLATVDSQLGRCDYITVELEDDSLQVAGNRDALRGAMLDLVKRALAVSGPNSSIELTAIRSGEYLYLAVIDSGRTRTADAGRMASTELPDLRDFGLSTVQSIAEDHGGYVAVDSNEHGATFAICLPVAANDDAAYADRNGASDRVATTAAGAAQ